MVGGKKREEKKGRERNREIEKVGRERDGGKGGKKASEPC